MRVSDEEIAGWIAQGEAARYASLNYALDLRDARDRIVELEADRNYARDALQRGHSNAVTWLRNNGYPMKASDMAVALRVEEPDGQD